MSADASASAKRDEERGYSESSERATKRRRSSTSPDARVSEVASTRAGSTASPCSSPDLEYEGFVDHEMLLASMYADAGFDLYAQQERFTPLLAELNLRALDLGVKNIDEQGQEMVNQCFYLSVVRSHLGHSAELAQVQQAALSMKRTVEDCVRKAHPDWATDEKRLGENTMASADFLPIAMAAKEPANVLARMAVVVLDAAQCCAEAYVGPQYASTREEADVVERPRHELERNLVLLVYTPGHYKALVCDDSCGSKPSWTYPELKALLEQRDVSILETNDFD